MTEVRIRHAEEGFTKTLGDVPFADVDTVMQSLRFNGLQSNGDYINFDNLTTSFQVDDTGAYFEVTISD